MTARGPMGGYYRPPILTLNAPGRMSGYTPPPYSLIWAAIEIKILYVLDEKLPSVV